MRIEKVGSKSYARVLDKTEAQLSNILNKYFNSTVFDQDAKESREAIIAEISTRLQPMIMNITQSMAYKQISDYVTIDMKPYIESMLVQLMSKAEKMQILYSTEHVQIKKTDSKLVVNLPETLVVHSDTDSLIILVNGAAQDVKFNYTLVLDTIDATKINAINFGINPGETAVLEEGDIITFNALIYGKVG